MHRRVRQFLWVLLVAALAGVFWPERAEHLQTSALDSHAAASQVRLPPPGATEPCRCDSEDLAEAALPRLILRSLR